MMRRSTGFTLLEVLIALVVLALALGAVVQTAGDFTVNQSYLRDRSLAEWVARNQLAVFLLSNEWPSPGIVKGEAEMPMGSADKGGRAWRWEAEITQTPEEDLRRVEIDVFPDGADDASDPLATLTGFIGKPS